MNDDDELQIEGIHYSQIMKVCFKEKFMLSFAANITMPQDVVDKLYNMIQNKELDFSITFYKPTIDNDTKNL
jgi:beta-xylosidase